MRVFENRLLRRIFGPKMDEVIEKWRKLHNELNDLVLLTQYCLSDQVEKMKMGGACRTYGREKRCIQCFGGETSGKESTWKTQAKMGG
jgi:hypothetical protein